MPRIFISYRRGATNAYAGRLYDRLEEHFGQNQVFMDIDTIPPGVDFVDHIQDAVGSCDAMVVLIGRDWVDARTADGRRRLDDPADFVRLEVATGLERGVRVVPVLVQDAGMPSAEELPEPLRHLSRRNALFVSDMRWRDDVGRLLRALDPVIGGRGLDRIPRALARPRIRVGTLAGAALAAAAVVAALILLGRGDEDPPPPPPSGVATARIPVGVEPVAAVVARDFVWVANARDGTVTKLDPRTNAPVSGAIAIGEAVTYLETDGRSVWVTNGGAGASGRGRLFRIDPATGGVAQSIPTGRFPAGVAVGDGAVWVSNAGDERIARYDAATGEPRGTVDVPGIVPLQLAASPGRLWVPDASHGRVLVVDTRRMRVAGEPIGVGRGPSGLAVGAGFVWVANAADDTVSRIDLRTARVVGPAIEVGRNPGDVAFGLGAVWVANEDAGTVTRIDPRTAKVTGPAIRVGRSPSGLAVGAGSLWVPNADDDTVSRLTPR